MAAHFCTPCKYFGGLMCPEDRPSPIFTVFSTIINGIMGIMSIAALSGGADDCASSMRTYVIIGIINCVINVIFAFYLYVRFAAKVREEATATQAAYKLFMYDWGVCVYILFSIWLVVWMVLASQSSDKTCNSSLANQITAGITFTIVYMAVGLLLVMLSIMTECCREPGWKRNRRQAPAVNRPPPTHHQPQIGAPVYAQPAHSQPPPPVNPAYAQQQQQQEQGVLGRAFGVARNAIHKATRPTPQQAATHV
jgi:hypothetical protein